jgi:hypothetical protein
MFMFVFVTVVVLVQRIVHQLKQKDNKNSQVV